MDDNALTPVPRRIAILGTGKMGSAIAHRLAASGFEIVLWNRTRSRAEALGVGTVAETPAAAARDADLDISAIVLPYRHEAPSIDRKLEAALPARR